MLKAGGIAFWLKCICNTLLRTSWEVPWALWTSSFSLLYMYIFLKKKCQVPHTSLSKVTNPLKYYYLNGNGEKSKNKSISLHYQLFYLNNKTCLSSTVWSQIETWECILNDGWHLQNEITQYVSHSPLQHSFIDTLYLFLFTCFCKTSEIESLHSWTSRKCYVILWKLLFQELLF